MGIPYDKLDARTKALVDDALAREPRPEPERSRQAAPRPAHGPLKDVVDIDGALHVRITRLLPRGGWLDDDNLSGGAKQLRDALASFLGRKGDSEADGLTWEYRQGEGDYETIIEVFKQEDIEATTTQI